MKSARSRREQAVGSFGIAAVLLVLTALAPLLRPDLFSGHDHSIRDIYRLAQLEKGLRAGYVFPRWQPDFYRGFGFPFFNFYQPLIYYIAFLFRLPGASYAGAVKGMIAAGIIGSAAAMYFCARALWRPPGAFISAVLYTYAFYHMADVYVRGSLAEAFSFVFFPLIFGALLRLKKPVYGYLLSLSTAGLLVCHNIEAMLFLPVAAAMTFLMWLLSERTFPLGRAVTAGLWGAALSAFFWIPAMAERSSVHISRLVEAGYNPMIHFLHPVQLLIDVWGHDASGPGMERFPFSQGWLMLILIAGALVSARSMPLHGRRRLYLIVFGYVFFLFLTVPASVFLWEHIPLLRMAQFPWRALAPAAFMGALAAGGAVAGISVRSHQTAAALIVALTALATQGKYIRALDYRTVPDSIASDAMIRRRGGTTTASNEYLPRWVPERRFLKDVLGIAPDRPVPNPVDLPILSDTGTTAAVSDLRKTDMRISFRAICPSGGCIVRLNTFYYPGWTAVDETGTRLDVSPSPLGLIDVAIPRGTHRVDVVFGATPLRRIASLLSLAALAAWISGFIWVVRRTVT